MQKGKPVLVHLPNYEKDNSYLDIRDGDFKENYLLYITCFNLGRHLKLMERRIINNFLTNKYIEETFDMIEEIGGRSNEILLIGTLLEAFQKIDPIKYKDRIIDVFELQVLKVDFNKKTKFKQEYEIYKIFKEKYLKIDLKLKFGNPISKLFYQALIYSHIKWIIFKLDETCPLLPLLTPAKFNALKNDLKYIVEDFHLKT